MEELDSGSTSSTAMGLLVATGVCGGIAGMIESAAQMPNHPVAGWVAFAGSAVLEAVSIRLSSTV